MTLLSLAPTEARPRRIGRVRLAAAIVLAAGTGARAASSDMLASSGVSFDPIAQETHVHERISTALCLSFRLAHRWTVSRSADATYLHAAGTDQDVEIRLRSASDLESFPQADVLGREAAALQRDHESTIGRPAQSIRLDPTELPGVSRWSATWIDPHFASAGHALTVETFIVDLKNAALELTLTKAGELASDQEPVRLILTSLRIRPGADCSPGVPAG